MANREWAEKVPFELGPDFPGSSGDRERGKFRPSKYERMTTVAVADDDGNPLQTSIQVSMTEALAEVVYELRLLRHALVLGGLAEDMGDME